MELAPYIAGLFALITALLTALTATQKTSLSDKNKTITKLEEKEIVLRAEIAATNAKVVEAIEKQAAIATQVADAARADTARAMERETWLTAELRRYQSLAPLPPVAPPLSHSS